MSELREMVSEKLDLHNMFSVHGFRVCFLPNVSTDVLTDRVMELHVGIFVVSALCLLVRWPPFGLSTQG